MNFIKRLVDKLTGNGKVTPAEIAALEAENELLYRTAEIKRGSKAVDIRLTTVSLSLDDLKKLEQEGKEDETVH